MSGDLTGLCLYMSKKLFKTGFKPVWHVIWLFFVQPFWKHCEAHEKGQIIWQLIYLPSLLDESSHLFKKDCCVLERGLVFGQTLIVLADLSQILVRLFIELGNLEQGGHNLSNAVVCCCRINNTQAFDEQLFGQVRTPTGHNQLPIFHCTKVHLRSHTCLPFKARHPRWRHKSEWAHNNSNLSTFLIVPHLIT